METESDTLLMLYASDSQSVKRRSQGIRDQLPRDPWIHFCNGYFEGYCINYRTKVLLKIIAERLLLRYVYVVYPLEYLI